MAASGVTENGCRWTSTGTLGEIINVPRRPHIEGPQMIRCRKCNRQLKSPASQIRGQGPKCAGESAHTVRFRRVKATGCDQPGLFDEHGECGDVIDFDLLRKNNEQISKREDNH